MGGLSKIFAKTAHAVARKTAAANSTTSAFWTRTSRIHAVHSALPAGTRLSKGGSLHHPARRMAACAAMAVLFAATLVAIASTQTPAPQPAAQTQPPTFRTE